MSKLLDKFIEIGFSGGYVYYKSKIGPEYAYEYIYAPTHLDNKYYSLLITTSASDISKLTNTASYRLAIINNEGEFVGYFFNLKYTGSSCNYIDNIINELFLSEIRDNELEYLLN